MIALLSLFSSDVVSSLRAFFAIRRPLQQHGISPLPTGPEDIGKPPDAILHGHGDILFDNDVSHGFSPRSNRLRPQSTAA
jgi:hypothetical protein